MRGPGNERSGADDQDRTGDLVLTKDALCQLSYIGRRTSRAGGERRMERETGIEPATNSLEGCDSTTELLPPSRLPPAILAAATTRRTRRRPFPPARGACCRRAPGGARGGRRLVAR